MSSVSPAVILYDANGIAMSVEDGVAIPSSTRGLLIAGKDGTGKSRFAMLDRFNGALATIDYSHFKVHESKHFFTQNWITVSGAGTVFDFLFDAGAANFPHFVFEFNAQTAFTFELYEAPTTTASGTALGVMNNNRNSSGTPIMAAYSGPTVTVVGTLLCTDQVSAGFKEGGHATRESEIILKAATKYLMRLTKTDAGSGTIGYHFAWYEA